MSQGVVDQRPPASDGFQLPARMEQLTARLYLRAIDQYEKILEKRFKLTKKAAAVDRADSADSKWRSSEKKDGSPLSSFRRWRRGASPQDSKNVSNTQPSDLLKFLAINALDLTAPASDVLLKSRSTRGVQTWFQLSGHPGSLAPAGPGTVWKRGAAADADAERDVYERLARCPHMRAAIPRYYREVEYKGDKYIELQDLLHGFEDPHVMDVKMGTRTFLESEVSKTSARRDLYDKMVAVDARAPSGAEHAARAVTKLRYMQFREAQSSTGGEGFRIEALRFPGEAPLTDLKKIKSRDQVAATIARFLCGRKEVRRKLVNRLEEIRSSFERSDFFKTHEIIGSSVFMIYDKKNVGVWLIDFAKTRSLPEGLTVDHRRQWEQGNHEEGFLFGMDRLISIMKDVDLDHTCTKK